MLRQPDFEAGGPLGGRDAAAMATALAELPGAAFLVDADLRYLVVAGRAAMDILQVHGLAPASLLGRRVDEVVGPPDLIPIRACYEAALAGAAPRFELLRGGRTFEISGHAALGPAGGAAAILYCHDVTERAEAREELARERARVVELLTDVETLVELLPDGLCIVDGERIRYANNAFARTLGYERNDDLAGVHLRSVVSPRDLELVCARFEGKEPSRPSRPGAVSSDVELVGADGRPVILEMGASRRVSHGGTQASVALFRDLRERRELEASARAHDRLATVGTLAAGIGHEISNPLTFVLSNLEMLAEELSSERPLSQAHRRELGSLVGEAIDGARRVEKVVRGLRAFARGEREERTRLDVRQVVEMSIAFAFSELRHRVHVERDLAPVPPVLADESRLAQVFINLLVNAAHVMQELPFDRNVVRVRTYAKGGSVHVDISDNGPGLTDEARLRVFEPFFAAKGPSEGSSLGLSIAYNIVSGLGGELTCQSRPGEGAAFTVALPAATDDAHPAPVPAPFALHLLRRGRVLVVDDEPLIGSVARRMLTARYDVTVVHSAEEALALLLGGQVYDCILCDLMMPGTSGMELFAQVGGVLPFAAERFVFVSAGPTTPEAARFAEATKHPILEKPFDAEELREAVRGAVVLGEQRRAKPSP